MKIEYSIRTVNPNEISKRTVSGEPVVFKGFEAMRFCIREITDDIFFGKAYTVDELSSGHIITSGKTRKAAINAAQKILNQKGPAVVKAALVAAKSKYGRLNPRRKKEVK